jgi:porphobilinogen synthase
MAGFPIVRLRRLRGSESVRRMVQETRLSASEFVYPLFVTEDPGGRKEIEPMPGCFQLPLSDLAAEAQEIASLGIPSVLLFGLPNEKDPLGMQAYDSQGIIQQAVRVIKKAAPGLAVMTDVCLCEYTDHGHCGVLRGESVDNDATLELLAKAAIAQVEAGADIVGPSAMMDGQIAALRKGLDGAGYSETPIMAYASKYASAFYGPFRVAADSVPQVGDRRGYQMDPANARMALRELEQDVEEGADILMVKPALSYLDVISKARERFPHPLAAYNVSGEYSMIKAAGDRGWLDADRVAVEVLTSIKRAGADIIITYFAKDVARWLKDEA